MVHQRKTKGERWTGNAGGRVNLKSDGGQGLVRKLIFKLRLKVRNQVLQIPGRRAFRAERSASANALGQKHS